MPTETRAQIDPQRVAALIEREEERFRKAHARSGAMWERARHVMPRGVPSSFQAK